MPDKARRVRLAALDDHYEDPDEPELLFAAQLQEIIRQYAEAVGVCPDCLARFPDPLEGRSLDAGRQYLEAVEAGLARALGGAE
jgi:hypothetical protein